MATMKSLSGIHRRVVIAAVADAGRNLIYKSIDTPVLPVKCTPARSGTEEDVGDLDRKSPDQRTRPAQACGCEQAQKYRPDDPLDAGCQIRVAHQGGASKVPGDRVTLNGVTA